MSKKYKVIYMDDDNVWVSLGLMVCSIVVEKIIDYVLEEIKES